MRSQARRPAPHGFPPAGPAPPAPAPRPQHRAVRHPLGRPRETLRPPRIVRVITSRPLSHPLPRAAQIPGNRARRLNSPASRGRAASPRSAIATSSIRTSHARSTPAQQPQSNSGWKRCACGSTPSPVNDVPAVSGKRCACGCQLRSEPTAGWSGRTRGERCRGVSVGEHGRSRVMPPGTRSARG
jgi:hypothetical protein